MAEPTVKVTEALTPEQAQEMYETGAFTSYTMPPDIITSEKETDQVEVPVKDIPDIPKPDLNIDVSGIVPLVGTDKAQQIAETIRASRIVEYNRKRLDEANKLSKQFDITTEEALSSLGATIDPGIIKRSQDIVKEAEQKEFLTQYQASPQGQKQQAEYNAALRTIKNKAPDAIVDGSIIIELALQAGINSSIIKKLGITQEQIDKAKRSISTQQLVTKYDIKRTKREEKELEEFIKDNYPTVYNIYKAEGAEKAINTYNQAVDSLSKFIVTVDEYKDGKKTTRPAGKGDQIDLVAAHNAGLENEIKLVYGASIIPDIMKAKSFESSLEELKTSYGNDVIRAYVEGMNIDRLQGLLEPEDYKKVESRYSDARNAFRLWSDKRKLTGKQWESLSDEEKIARSNASWTLITQYAPAIMAPTFAGYLQNTNAYLDKFPKAISITGRVGVGAIMEAPYYRLNMTLAAAGIATATNKIGYTKQVAGGVWDFFKSIPSQIKINPANAANLAGVFLGAGRVVRGAKSAVARLDPWYTPNQGIRYTFTTGKISTSVGEIAQAIKDKKITEVTVARAIARAQSRFWKEPTKTAEARIGRTNIKVVIEATPWNQKFGAVFWHATANSKPYVGKNFVVNVTGSEPALFTSLQAAPRFAITTASGVKATSPALVMVYTKKGISFYPAAIEGAKTLNEMRSKGFQYLGSGEATPGAYSAIKEYLKRFELEAMLPNGMKIYRVNNFRSRIFGASAGEFVTTVDGWVLPIYRFAEKGAKVPDIPIAELAALRIDAIIQGLKVLFGKKGFKTEAGYANTGILAKQIDTAARLSIRGVSASQYQQKYREAVDKEMIRRLEEIYRSSRTTIEREYRNNPERFEDAYLNRVSRSLAKVYNTRLIDSRPTIPRSIERNLPLEREIRQNREERLARELNIIERPTRLDTDRIRENITDRVIRDTPERITVTRTTIERPPTGKTKSPPIIPSSKTSKTKEESKIKKKFYPLTWHQSKIAGWITIYPPYKQENIKRTLRPPKGAIRITKENIGTAYETIQGIGGDTSILLKIDAGNQDIIIKNPTNKPGKKGAIRYKLDEGNKTKNPLTLSGVKRK